MDWRQFAVSCGFEATLNLSQYFIEHGRRRGDLLRCDGKLRADDNKMDKMVADAHL